MSVPFIEENDQTRARHEHLDALRRLVGNVYPNKFERSHVIDPQREDTVTALVEKYRAFAPVVAEGERPPAEAIELANQQLNQVKVRIAGRIASPPRVMGKAAFVHLSDGVTRLQIYVKRADAKGVSNEAEPREVDGWELFGLLDHGDFIGVAGYLFITKTGELSVHVEQLQFLSKALLPLPDKMHGIHDPEIRQRQRYADLIAGSLKLERDEDDLTPREVFERRSAIIRELRRILDEHGYVEVETPMLTSKATGAAARPFKTHHNALDIDLFARIAPELYLKRLLVGGFEKVYELNRNFRNEGIDRTHNPEFTMLEFYWAYADVNQMMDFCEEMFRSTVFTALGHTHVKYRGQDIDFSQPFARLTMIDAIAIHLKTDYPFQAIELDGTAIERFWFDDAVTVAALNQFLRWWVESHATILRKEVWKDDGTSSTSLLAIDMINADDPGHLLEDTGAETYRSVVTGQPPSKVVEINWKFAKEHWSEQAPEANARFGANLLEIFGLVAEKRIVQPTFIVDYPKSISPLSKSSPADGSIAERFELFIDGMECANGFSELNDPAEQYQRFMDQMTQRERGDEEAMVMDEDYIRALSYGMPPAAGIGIGIDRFVMLLTNKQSIRDVILFPHMRPERKAEEQEENREG
jgi:lysyl-tRNA synthetase class 2